MLPTNLNCIFNGELIKLEDCRLDIFELGYHRGYAVFDFCRSINGKIRFLEDYLDRFERSVRLSKIHCPFSRDDIRQSLLSLLMANDISDGAFKLMLSAGSAQDGATVNDLNTNLIILNSPFIFLPKKYYKEGVALISKKYQRENPLIKSTNYFFALQHRHELQSKGAIDILYYQDYIFETSRANVFFVNKGKIYTPSEGMLPGVIRKHLIKKNPEIIETRVPHDFIQSCDEIFITSSSKEIMPVVRIDDMPVGTGKVGQVFMELNHQF